MATSTTDPYGGYERFLPQLKKHQKAVIRSIFERMQNDKEKDAARLVAEKDMARLLAEKDAKRLVAEKEIFRVQLEAEKKISRAAKKAAIDRMDNLATKVSVLQINLLRLKGGLSVRYVLEAAEEKMKEEERTGWMARSQMYENYFTRHPDRADELWKCFANDKAHASQARRPKKMAEACVSFYSASCRIHHELHDEGGNIVLVKDQFSKFEECLLRYFAKIIDVKVDDHKTERLSYIRDVAVVEAEQKGQGMNTLQTLCSCA